MSSFFKSLFRFNLSKIDVKKGFRQCLLMIIPALIGYYSGHFQFGVMVATGTLAHIYIFSGPAKSMLRTVILCSLGFTVCMILGTLTVPYPLLFGVLLLFVTVIPFYIFTALKIAGPSSTFFIVTFSLPINLPIQPDQALVRGLGILIGGLLATLMVLLMIWFRKGKPEDQAIIEDFNLIQKLMHDYNNPEQFEETARSAVYVFKSSDKLLITSNNTSSKLSARFQKLLLLHTSAQGIYSELLELNAQRQRPLPEELVEMIDYIINREQNPTSKQKYWRKEVNVDPAFDNLMNHILKLDETLQANDTQIEHEADSRKPLYSKRILHNLTLESIVFRNTIRYTAIMMVSIFIALMFDFDKAYWVPLSTHTMLLGTSTVHALERGMARSLGTIFGVLVLSVILLYTIPLPLAIIMMGLAAGVTETFVGSNYTFAVIFITIQVILLNGLASKNLSIMIALPRVIDVILGVLIAVVGLFILGQRTASALLPRTIAEVVRKEATIFHYLFSENGYAFEERQKEDNLSLSVKLSNMTQMYQTANGELFSNKTAVRNYYPSIYALEEISFMLNRAMNNPHRYKIDDKQMGEYLVAFEDIAKHFELKTPLNVKTLSNLPQYNYIQAALTNIQHTNALSEKRLEIQETH